MDVYESVVSFLVSPRHRRDDLEMCWYFGNAGGSSHEKELAVLLWTEVYVLSHRQ
jgi:hypothetical protein